MRLLVCVALAMAVPVAAREPTPLRAGVRDEFGRLTYIRFLHTPKTGTSFIASIRNYLTACELKDYTCNGWLGGHVEGNPNKAPWERSDPNAVSEDLHTCNRHMSACNHQNYHDAWRDVDGTAYDVVTLLRLPQQLSKSGLRFTNHVREVSRPPMPPVTLREFLLKYDNTMTKMLSGYGFHRPVMDLKRVTRAGIYGGLLKRARQNLFNNTAFWGITDYWNATVCLFHKELNGPGPRDSEYMNTRKMDHSAENPSKKAEQLHAYQTLRNRWDYALYAEALPVFFERVEAAGCELGVPRPSPAELAELMAVSTANETELEMELYPDDPRSHKELLKAAFAKR